MPYLTDSQFRELLVEIVNKIAKNFRCFGGGYTSESNPIAAALKDQRPQFALGVDVAEVVLFVMTEFAEFILAQKTQSPENVEKAISGYTISACDSCLNVTKTYYHYNYDRNLCLDCLKEYDEQECPPSLPTTSSD